MNTSTPDPISPTARANPAPERCPLCQRPNQCAITAGQVPESCWCWGVHIPAGTLAGVPAEAVGRACICADCTTQHPAPQAVS